MFCRSWKRRSCSCGVDLQPELHQHRAEVGELPLELVDLVVGPLPVGLAAKSFHPLDQHAAVPGAVEDRDMPGLGNAPPETPEIMMGLFLLRRRGDGHDLVAPRVEAQREPLDVAALAAGVPAFVADHRRNPRKVQLMLGLEQPLVELFALGVIGLPIERKAQIDAVEDRARPRTSAVTSTVMPPLPQAGEGS